jgi:capsular polysaccharide biosynthesis protein
MMLGTQLVKDYRELVKSRMVSNIVIQELGLKNITTERLAQKITVTSKNDTRVIQISSEDGDPELAMNITNKVADIFKTQVVEIMKVENVQIIDKAEKATHPVRPNKRNYLAISFILGLALGLFIIFLIEFLDNTIKTPEDVAKHLDIPVIGTIPVFPK